MTKRSHNRIQIFYYEYYFSRIYKHFIQPQLISLKTIIYNATRNTTEKIQIILSNDNNKFKSSYFSWKRIDFKENISHTF